MTNRRSWRASARDRNPPHAGGFYRFVTLAFVVLLLSTATLAAVGVAGVAGAQSAGNDAPATTAPETETPAETESSDSDAGSSEWSVDDVREGGTTISGAAPSMRWLSDEGSVYVDYRDPNPLVGSGKEDWEAGTILKPGSRVQADELRVHAQRARTAGIDTFRLRIVYAEIGTTRVQEGNTTRTVSELQNVTTQTERLEFSGPFDAESVDLRRSDTERHVLMLLEDPETGEEMARWTFRHESVATTQSAGISSMGDLLGWVFWWIAGPLVLLTVVVGVLAKWAVEKAGKGPDKGGLFWSVVLSCSTFLVVAVAYVWLADWLVAAPLAIPVALALIMGIVYLETYSVGVEEVEFIKPELELATSPSGERAVDVVSVESTKEKVVQNGPRDFAVVRDGIRPFVSRLFGGAAPLIGADDLATRFDVRGDDADHDAKVFVHPRSGSVVDYEPEGWKLEVPALETREDYLEVGALIAVSLAFTAGVMSAFGGLAGSLAFVGVLALIALRPSEGYAKVYLAPAHMRAAFASMLYLAREVDDADTIEEARNKLVQKEARSEKDVEEALTKRDSTLVQEMFNADAEEAVESLDSDENVDDLLKREEEETIEKEVLGDD